MSVIHKQMARGKWQKLSLPEQMANIGSEVYRAILWRKKGDGKYAQMAFEQALELFDLTLSDPQNRKRLKEIARARETFVDYFEFENQYRQTPKMINNYFYNFNFLARKGT